MTLWSRSDLAAVTVSVDAHGGCGKTHSRPVNGDRPVPVWKLDCTQCEDHLRHDPHWSVTASEIPETHDEKKAREDFEKRGALDERRLMMLAFARAYGIDIPATLAGLPDHALENIPGMLECPNGHATPPGKPFCADCGSPMSAPVTKAALSAPERRAEPPAAEPPSRPRFTPQRLSDARQDQLQALARQRGLSEDGTRKQLVDRLTGAGVTNADFRRFLEPVAA